MSHRRVLLGAGIAAGVVVAIGTLRAASQHQRPAMESPQESAKRRAPTAKPVVHKGIRYEQLRGARTRGFDQNGGIIVATDVKTGKELWTVQVYKTTYDRHEETDAQDVYIREMHVDAKAHALVVQDERGRTYSISLTDHSVTPKP